MVFAGSPCPCCNARNQAHMTMGTLDSSNFSFPGFMMEKTHHKDFSAGKAVVGAFLVGPIGLVAGAIGKDAKYYVCSKCGFTCDSNGREISF